MGDRCKVKCYKREVLIALVSVLDIIPLAIIHAVIYIYSKWLRVSVTALAENGSYGTRRGHVTSRDQGIVYNFSRYCLSFPFLFFSFRSSFIDNPIVQVARIPFAVLLP